MTATTPTLVYKGSEVPTSGAPIDVEYEDGPILWDDDSAILWDDGTPIVWSHLESTNPDMIYAFSSPRLVYSGEAE